MKIDIVASYPTKEELLSINAEARVYRGAYLGCDVVIKERVSKKYRNPSLDIELRKSRAFTEAKVLYHANQEKIRVPAIFFVHPIEFYIVMEYVAGQSLKNYLEHHKDLTLLYKAGQQVAMLHNINVVHGDLTTSNLLVSDGQITMIDFGLAQYTTAIEDKAVDINVFYRTLESTHPNIWKLAWDEFIRGYGDISTEFKPVMKRMEKIDERVRYKKH